jgi:hypothetical protein
MKTWEEMTDTERTEMLSPTREQLTWDGTSVRVPKIKNPEEWMPYLSPYMQMKYFEAMSWSHEAAALGYAVSACSEIMDDALLEHYKFLLGEAVGVAATFAGDSEAAAHSLQLARAQRQRGGYKRHWLTNLVKGIVLQKWAAMPESERSPWGAKTVFAHWVQDTFHYPKGGSIPDNPKTVLAWITEWEKRKQQLPQ